mmetsp:Transcript_2922/g.2758  ORF Transcript_2922/g.2758 Transcript_2922/m.2758 type:complete len:87 (-) Transcript_2922:393-653(-)
MGKKKLAGIDFESLKKKVEINPAIEKIKEQIQENTKSTEWNLQLDIEKILIDEKDTFDETLRQISALGKKDKKDEAFKKNQFDLEI